VPELAVKKSKILIIILVILIICAAIPISVLSALWMDDIPTFQSSPPLQAVEKVRKAEKQGGTVELNESEINSIIDLFTQKQNVIPYVDDIKLKLGDGSIEIYAQGLYAGRIKFLLYSRGTVAYEGGNITFTPEKFKAGRLTVPKNTVLNFLAKKLAKKSPDQLAISEGNIILGKKLLPVDINSISVTADKVIIGFNQPGKSSPADHGSGTADGVPNDNAGQGQNPGQNSGQNQDPGNNQGQPSGSQGDQPGDQDQLSPEEIKNLLAQVSHELSVVHGVVKSDKEKVLIATMISTVNNLMANPDYPYEEKAAWVLSEYKKLSSKEKDDLKKAMLDNMTVSTALEVKKLFGL
jgi:uncharacterized protein YpmS